MIRFKLPSSFILHPSSLLTPSIALLLFIGGCGVKAPIQGRQDPYAPSQIMYVDKDLQRSTAVGIPIATRDEAGLLHIQVPIRSTRDRQMIIDYRYRFVDRNGQDIWSSHWKDKVLAPNVPDSIIFNSTTNAATDFQLDLRYAK